MRLLTSALLGLLLGCATPTYNVLSYQDFHCASICMQRDAHMIGWVQSEDGDVLCFCDHGKDKK